MPLNRLPAQRIEFAKNGTRIAPYAWLVLAGGIIVLGTGMHAYTFAGDALTRPTRTEIGRSPLAEDRKYDEAALRRLKQEWTEAEKLNRHLAMPWHSVFEAVESASTDEIVLTALKPDSNANRVALSGDAKDFVALLSFVARLEVTQPFTKAYLTGHEYKAEASGYAVRFTAVAEWSGR